MTARPPDHEECGKCGHASRYHTPRYSQDTQVFLEMGACSICSCGEFKLAKGNEVPPKAQIVIRNTVDILDYVTRNGYGKIPAWVYNDVCEARKKLKGLLDK